MLASRTDRITLWLSAVAAGTFVVLSLMVACRADAQPPVIEEHVDAIVLVQSPDGMRVVFLRHGQVLATRILCDDMVWAHSSGVYRLMWNDYAMAERVVTAPRFSICVVQSDPLAEASLPWWAMQRNMRDLRQP